MVDIHFNELSREIVRQEKSYTIWTFLGIIPDRAELYSVPSRVWTVSSLSAWKFWKIRDDFDVDGQSMGPPARSNATARRGRNHLEFFKIFMQTGTELSTLSMGKSITGNINMKYLCNTQARKLSADLGGATSLWIGFCMATFVEIADVFVRHAIDFCCSLGKRKQRPDQAGWSHKIEFRRRRRGSPVDNSELSIHSYRSSPSNVADNLVTFVSLTFGKIWNMILNVFLAVDGLPTRSTSTARQHRMYLWSFPKKVSW